METWTPNPDLLRPSPVLCLLPSLSLGFYREFSCPVFFTPSSHFLSWTTAYSLPSLGAGEPLCPVGKRAKGTPGVQGMKCRKAQSKDDILSANGQSLPCKKDFHASPCPSLRRLDISKPARNVSQKTKEEREAFVKVSLPLSQLTPDLKASPLHLNMCTLEEEGNKANCRVGSTLSSC